MHHLRTCVIMPAFSYYMYHLQKCIITIVFNNMENGVRPGQTKSSRTSLTVRINPYVQIRQEGWDRSNKIPTFPQIAFDCSFTTRRWKICASVQTWKLSNVLHQQNPKILKRNIFGKTLRIDDILLIFFEQTVSLCTQIKSNSNNFVKSKWFHFISFEVLRFQASLNFPNSYHDCL